MDESDGGSKDDGSSTTSPVDPCRNRRYPVVRTLPHDPDILEKIMSHLPAASLLPCRRVCKRWDQMVRQPNTLRLWAEQNAPIDTWVPFSFVTGRTSSLLLYNGRTREWKAQQVQPGDNYSRLFGTSSHGLLILADALRTRRRGRSDSFSFHLNESLKYPRVAVLNPITHVRRVLPHLPNAERLVSICGAKFLDFEDVNYGGSAHYRILVISKCFNVHDDFPCISRCRRGDVRRGKPMLTSHVFSSKSNEWYHIGGLSLCRRTRFHVTSICQLFQVHGEVPEGSSSRSGGHVRFHFEVPENFDLDFGLEGSLILLGYDSQKEVWIQWRIRGSTWLGDRDSCPHSYRLPGGFIQRQGELLVIMKEEDSQGQYVGVGIHSLSIQVDKPREDQHWKLVSEMPSHLFKRFHYEDNQRSPCRKHHPHIEDPDENFIDCLVQILCVADQGGDQILFVGNSPSLVVSYRFSSSVRGEWEWVDLQIPAREGSTSEFDGLSLNESFNTQNILGMNFGLQLRPDITP